jgi:hypothetical protein
MDYCTSQFKIKSTRRLINSLVLRHSDKVIQTQVARKNGSARKYRQCFSKE